MTLHKDDNPSAGPYIFRDAAEYSDLWWKVHPPPAHSERTSRPDNSSFSKCFISSPLSPSPNFKFEAASILLFFASPRPQKWRITEMLQIPQNFEKEACRDN